ncbi:4Fe-4S binding protein [Methanobrevibacter sp. DSM 116169]|uniref:4Fe-4S binding protein n=1 Tax=Methanobrevibacter sp. DSM 116169 TaxID=3242727 RepID=UPI0038FCA993
MKINSKDCALCDICIKMCPEKAIKKIAFKVIITDKCTNCDECLDVCPVGAILKD